MPPLMPLRLKLLTLILAINIFHGTSAYADNNHIYSTGPLVEIDRCASVWLIKRFVDREAEFRFFPDGELVTQGIVFDRPEAKLRRTHRSSTFEAILAEYNLKEEKLTEIAAIIHDIEINAWEKRKNHRKILQAIAQIIGKNKTETERLSGCLEYFDNYPDVSQPSTANQ